MNLRCLPPLVKHVLVSNSPKQKIDNKRLVSIITILVNCFAQKSYSQHYYNHPNCGQFCSPKNHMIMLICSSQECCRIRDRLVCSPCLPSSRYHLPPSRVSVWSFNHNYVYLRLFALHASTASLPILL